MNVPINAGGLVVSVADAGTATDTVVFAMNEPPDLRLATGTYRVVGAAPLRRLMRGAEVIAVEHTDTETFGIDQLHRVTDAADPLDVAHGHLADLCPLLDVDVDSSLHGGSIAWGGSRIDVLAAGEFTLWVSVTLAPSPAWGAAATADVLYQIPGDSRLARPGVSFPRRLQRSTVDGATVLSGWMDEAPMGPGDWVKPTLDIVNPNGGDLAASIVAAELIFTRVA